MHPVPGHEVSTEYGKRGKWWSCLRNAAGEGVHTGIDIAAPAGTPIVAPINGQIRWRSYGSAFGKHQFAISPDSDQPFGSGEVFFAHTRTRPKDGIYVKAGQVIAEVGSEGNVTGPHLHMEYIPRTKNRWACGIHANPQPILDWEEDMAFWMKYSGKPSGNLRLKADGTYVTIDATVPPPPRGGTREDRMVYLNLVPTWKLPKSDPLYYFQTASVRVRWTRAGDPPDRTAYQDFTITPWRSSFLLTHTHWETGEKGRGGKWSVSVVGHCASVYASTRYTKSAVE
jgi:Peptidase family M23